jgi:hypothetical protein
MAMQYIWILESGTNEDRRPKFAANQTEAAL